MVPKQMLISAQLRQTGWRKRVLAVFGDHDLQISPSGLLKTLRDAGQPIHRPTLYRVVQDLEKSGLLICTGSGAQKRYRLKR